MSGESIEEIYSVCPRHIQIGFSEQEKLGYLSEIKEITLWLHTIGKNPRKAEGYAEQTISTTL